MTEFEKKLRLKTKSAIFGSEHVIFGRNEHNLDTWGVLRSEKLRDFGMVDRRLDAEFDGESEYNKMNNDF